MKPRSLAIAFGAKKNMDKKAGKESSVSLPLHMDIVHGLMAKKMAKGGMMSNLPLIGGGEDKDDSLMKSDDSDYTKYGQTGDTTNLMSSTTMGKGMAKGGRVGSSGSQDEANSEVNYSLSRNVSPFKYGGDMNDEEDAEETDSDLDLNYKKDKKMYDGGEVESEMKSPFDDEDDSFLDGNEQSPEHASPFQSPLTSEYESEREKSGKKDMISRIMAKLHAKHRGQ